MPARPKTVPFPSPAAHEKEPLSPSFEFLNGSVCFPDIVCPSLLFLACQMFSGVRLQLRIGGIAGLMLVEKPLQPFVYRSHLLHGVHGMVGSADLPDDGRTHDLIDPIAQLPILFAVIVLVGGRQDLMTGVLYGLIPFDIGVDDPVEIGFVPANPF